MTNRSNAHSVCDTSLTCTTDNRENKRATLRQLCKAETAPEMFTRVRSETETDMCGHD